MSEEIIIDSVKLFLKEDTNNVLGIYGEWGNGKTIFWNNFIKENKTLINKRFLKYSYVSLFGINSVEQLKLALLLNKINITNIGEYEPTLKECIINLLKNLNTKNVRLLNKKIFSLSQFLSKSLYFSTMLDVAKNHSIDNTIICLDDLERAGNDLKINEIMGYISELKEQKNCKVVLIYNINEVKEKDNNFYELHEKVIDKNILFSLPTDNCIDLIFSDKKSLTYSYVRKYIPLLNLKNMRIIAKINQLSKIIENRFPERFEAQTLEHAIKSLCLFSYIYYSKGNDIPDIEDIKNSGDTIASISQKIEETTKNKNINIFLTNYGYQITTKMDELIAQGVITGILDIDNILSEMEPINSEYKKDNSKNELYAQFDNILLSTDEDQSEKIQQLYRFCNNNLDICSAMDIDFVIRLLKSTNFEINANKLKSAYIEYLKSNRYRINPQTYPFYAEIRDEDLKIALEGNNKSLTTKVSFADAVEHIAQNNGWSHEHIVALNEASEEQIIQLITSLKSRKLIVRYIRVLMSFSGNKETDIFEKSQRALRKISQRSSLNAFVLEPFIK